MTGAPEMHGATHRQLSITAGAAVAAATAPVTWPAAAMAGALVWMCSRTGSLPDTLEHGVFRHHRGLRILTVGGACGLVAAVGAPLLTPVVALWLEPFGHRTELHDPALTLPVLGFLTWAAALAGPLALVPVGAVTIGWTLHLLADACTPHGLPITWWKDDDRKVRSIHLLPMRMRIPTRGRPGVPKPGQDPDNFEDPRERKVRSGARVLCGLLLLLMAVVAFQHYLPTLRTAAAARECTTHAAKRTAAHRARYDGLHGRLHVTRLVRHGRRAVVRIQNADGTARVVLRCSKGRWHVR